MSEQVTIADILDHLRKLYDGQALMNETLGLIKARLLAIEERLEGQTHDSLQDAQYSVALGEGLAELMEEVSELKVAVAKLEQNGIPPRILN